jgi:hypothetical protein
MCDHRERVSDLNLALTLSLSQLNRKVPKQQLIKCMLITLQSNRVARSERKEREEFVSLPEEVFVEFKGSGELVEELPRCVNKLEENW